jgi:cysteate synthase
MAYVTSIELPARVNRPERSDKISRHYRLRCLVCGDAFHDDGFMLECPAQHEDGLLGTEYVSTRYEKDDRDESIHRYHQWLPVIRNLPGVGRTITYRSKQLAHLLGLQNLWIAFNGYWPERGARLETATFKELEAWSVLCRLPDHHSRVLVIASAGNTAAAFARMCSENAVPCLIIVPERALPRMQFIDALHISVRIVCLSTPADYCDAIALASRISKYPGFLAEGGVRNVARRDGLATTLLSAVEAIGELPQYYFQAVGSGAGGIAVHEAAQRLLADGRFGVKLPRLMLSQNTPFCPIYDLWQSRDSGVNQQPGREAATRAENMLATVLSNRRPCYSIKGGVRDALLESGGDMLVADNEEAFAACQLFREAEGIDIEPAAGVALASLIKVRQEGRISTEARVLLNITGGGWQRRRLEHSLVPARPALTIAEPWLQSNRALESVLQLA